MDADGVTLGVFLEETITPGTPADPTTGAAAKDATMEFVIYNAKIDGGKFEEADGSFRLKLIFKADISNSGGSIADSLAGGGSGNYDGSHGGGSGNYDGSHGGGSGGNSGGGSIAESLGR